MKKFLHPGVNVFQNDTGDYVVHFDQPLVTIKDRTYNSTDAFLSDLYHTVFTTLSTLISETQELKRDTAKYTKPMPNTAAFYLVPKPKKATKPKTAYNWNPQIPAHESIYTMKASDPNGLTPEEVRVNSNTTPPALGTKKSNTANKNKAKPVKKNTSEAMRTAASRIFAEVSSVENTNAKKDVTLENVRDHWITQVAGECFKACADILNALKIKPIGGNINQLQMALETADHTSIHATNDFDKGINYIDEQLDKGNGVRVGVNHTLNYKDGKLPNEPPGVPATTDHYVVIYGRGYDVEKKEYYYLYADVASAEATYGESPDNKLYLDEKNKTLSGLRPFQSSSGKNVTYTVSQVSANEVN